MIHDLPSAIVGHFYSRLNKVIGAASQMLHNSFLAIVKGCHKFNERHRNKLCVHCKEI